MKIALTIHALRKGGGGMERSAADLSAAWAGLGHDVTIYALAGNEAKLPHAFDPRVGIRALGLNRPASNKVGAIREILRTMAGVRRALLDAETDVVVAIGNQTAVATLAGTLLSGVPVIVAERTHPAMYHIGRGWKELRQLLYPLAAALVAQTGDIARWYETHLRARRVYVVPNAVAEAHCQANPEREGRKEVVALGRLDEIKGFDVLVKLFATLAADYPEWDLCIYGEGPERARLERLVAEHGLEGRVFLPGWVEDPQRHLSQGDLFTLTSRTEGFPNALCEAMACGLPAVVFDCPSGPADIIRPGVDGRLVPPGDVERFARELAELMEDADERQHMGARAREIVERFSEERVTGLWAKLFAEVASS
ncbi:glycosyltransferase family 4 protein [Pseudodesulfovibrio sp.]|uniref:glycosyltransferase family 4 protein n=1 Tax=unclassified Pseudodesulfovibrio TaxID=2661612 RepID=UPI003B005398